MLRYVHCFIITMVIRSDESYQVITQGGMPTTTALPTMGNSVGNSVGSVENSCGNSFGSCGK